MPAHRIPDGLCHCSRQTHLQAYLVDVDSYEFMQNRMKILEGISRGERAILEGRTYTQDEAKEKMKKWLI